MNSRFLRNGMVMVVLVVVTGALLYALIQPAQAGTQSLTSFQQDVQKGLIKSVSRSDNTLTVTKTDGTTYTVQSDQPAVGDQTQIESWLSQANLNPFSVDYKVVPPADTSWIFLLITTLLPVMIIVLFIVFFMRQAQGTNNQAMSFGKSRARMFLGNKTVVTFADVAGVDEAKTELQEVVEFLKYPEKFNSLGARIPRGVLLVGPPGTGKTLLARAVAGEAGVPFFSISGSEFVEMFVGVGASRVRDLFDQAKRNSPCIVFVDEIDAVGRQRGAGLGGSHDEREQTLNQILVEMDGFDTNTNVIVVAATNRPDVLDPALLRPGRFDRQVILDRPDLRGRVAILKVHTKGKPLDKAIDIESPRPPVRRLLRRGSGQPRERGRHPGRPAQPQGHRHARVQRSARAHRGRTRAQEPPHLRRREARSSPSTKAATRSSSGFCPSATRSTRSRSSAAAWPWATPWPCRWRTAICSPRPSSRTRSPACSAATPPSGSSSATPRPAPPTTSRRRPTSPAGWSPSGA